ncbi:MAG: hypothetical protein IPH94_15095 [Saprospiraceae bacterium]|nr:hypothetical protein [Saprospiraceae bacterium]
MKFKLNIISAFIICFVFSNVVVAQDDPDAPAVDKAALREGSGRRRLLCHTDHPHAGRCAG